MKERPIIYSAPMVLAKLAGRKTQTRRIVKPQPPTAEAVRAKSGTSFSIFTDRHAPTYFRVGGPVWAVRELMGANPEWHCPYGMPGDRLWGRETFGIAHEHSDLEWDIAVAQAQQKRNDCGVVYRADANGGWALSHLVGDRWRPSIFMPRWASRLLDEVVAVRVERLQDISAEDAIAEGLTEEAGSDVPFYGCPGVFTADFTDPRDAYRELWSSINGPESWAANPWVWVVETKAVKP